MAFNSSNVVAWHDLSLAEHVAARNTHHDRGFRPLSLSLHGTAANPRYTSVMVKRSTAPEVRYVMNRTFQQFQDNFNEMVGEGFGPFILTATGPRGQARFSACFRQMNPIPLTRHDLSLAEFQALNREQKDRGRILLWADSFGTPSDTRYCGIWVRHEGSVAWNVDALDEGGDRLQQRFQAMRSVGARPALVAITPAGRTMEMFVDSQVGEWSSRVLMTGPEYQRRFNANTAKGLWPVRVSARGTGSAARFSAIFATRETVSPRTFRGTGTPAVPAIDALMREVMEERNLRGAALAVGVGTRLLYARGYTLAEANYPTTQPDTFFRLASISKTYCALAIWRLIQEGRLQLDQTLQSVLDLRRLNGSAPRDARFGDITIQHLLESRSGLPQRWNLAVAAAEEAGQQLPSDGLQIARHIAGLDLTGDPGDLNNAAYGNVDYLMLSQVVRRIMGRHSFNQALSPLLYERLHLNRTRPSRSLTGLQSSDEARSHMTVHDPERGWALHQLQCDPSVRTPDRPLVPAHYGGWDWEMMDGCGGLSASVVDVARLGAVLACRTQNPLLTPATIDRMFDLSIACVQNQRKRDGTRAHGYHGFDRPRMEDEGQRIVSYGKGGWLPGLGTSLSGVTGGFFYVYFQNGNSPDGARAFMDRLDPIVQAHSWGNEDRFTDFGIPSLPTGRRIRVPVGGLAATRVRVGNIAREAMEMVEADMNPIVPPRPPRVRIPRR
jgi:CubicO group peptidase (beta-lactamase class C family)